MSNEIPVVKLDETPEFKPTFKVRVTMASLATTILSIIGTGKFFELKGKDVEAMYVYDELTDENYYILPGEGLLGFWWLFPEDVTVLEELK